MRALLILACSATKRVGEHSAYELYDGPAYRVLRASGWPNTERGPDCRVLILSAEHGLLSAWAPINAYDRKMTAERADELAACPEDAVIAEVFRPVLPTRRRAGFDLFPTSEVYVFGGALYRRVVEAWERAGVFDRVPGGVAYSNGGIGQQLGQLKGWLDARTRGSSEVHVA